MADATVSAPLLEVRGLAMAYGGFLVQRDVSFSVERGRVFVLMGDSGSGKSTLLRLLIGLKTPAAGQVLYDGASFWDAAPEERARWMRRFGVLFQAGALWSSLTLAENIGLPLGEYTDLSGAEIRDLAEVKLALVGLAGFEDHYPAEISGGMRKRAGLARALALDPEILFFDEPSAGLDPLSSRRLDDLILELRDGLGTTIVVVTHELASIFAIADDSVFLDAQEHTVTARGNPRTLLAESSVPKVRAFLSRGQTDPAAPAAAGGGRGRG